MDNSLTTLRMKCNTKIKINFDGGDLSSDAGLLPFKEFLSKIGADKLIKHTFKTNDSAKYRPHNDGDNLLQVVYQIISAYFEDDCADELTNDPVMTAVLGKKALASQPTLSRFYNRMDTDTMSQFNGIMRALRKTIYSINKPEHILFDIDTTLFATYGRQEGEGFNYHYQAHGYHPLLCFDGLTGDLLKAELREGAKYCSNGAADFMRSLLAEYSSDYPEIPLFLRGDSGFASPDLYEILEKYDCKYAIRLKENSTLRGFVAKADEALFNETKLNQIDYAVKYGEFKYQAGSWSHPRRVVFKIEKPQGQMTHTYTFVVTTTELEPSQVIMFYCQRGSVESFIKEAKCGSDFASTSSKSMIVNANRLQVHVLAYNLFNWFKRLVLPEKMRKQQIDTIRLKLIKIATRVVKSGRYIIFKLCSSCPYKKEFYETMENIHRLQPQLE